MVPLELRAYAKVNLSLDIFRRLEDGYHEIASVMQQLALHDTITIREWDYGIHISANDPGVPQNQENSVWKAIDLLCNRCNVKKGVHAFIDKDIPVQGGLGGGSADAACVLRGLNEFWGLGLSIEELVALGTEIGYDVCYCIVGGTALVTGKGELVTPLPPAPRLPVVVAHPGFGIGTGLAYRELNPNDIGLYHSSERMIQAITGGNKEDIINSLHNDFETSILHDYPEIGSLKRRLKSKGALGVLLSGSGSSVFGIMDSIKEARAVAQGLQNEGLYTWGGWSHNGHDYAPNG